MLHLNAILHPTDYSEHSKFAFRLACSLASDHEARLIILHVVATMGPELVPAGEAATQLQPDGYQSHLWDDLRRVQSPDPSVSVEHRLAVGDPATEILRTARDAGCDLVVLATHGRTGVQRLLMGSVAEQVVRKATCPVLTVKAPQSHSPAHQAGSG